MLEGGYFIGGGNNSGETGSSDVFLEGDNIIFSPIDPIYIDENDNVFYSTENKNAYMYQDDSGNVFVRVVN